jgi:NAD(P)-dependent dehydrogenase (short-subunit alcohol dehydrogenase family)
MAAVDRILLGASIVVAVGGPIMQKLTGRKVVVTGGSRGLGLGIVEALVAQGAKVTAVARDRARLAEIERALGVVIVAGDATDPQLATAVLREATPDVLILNAGATPVMAPLHEQTWDSFSEIWNTDVCATFHWIQQALRQPLAQGSRVLVTSSGAALAGSPLSGGYAGAKRMQWLLASYANGVSADLDRGIRFQAVLPRQIIGDTELGRAAAEAYAKAKRITTEQFLATFGKPLSPRQVGEHLVTILTDAAHDGATAFELRGETGIRALEG